MKLSRCGLDEGVGCRRLQLDTRAGRQASRHPSQVDRSPEMSALCKRWNKRWNIVSLPLFPSSLAHNEWHIGSLPPGLFRPEDDGWGVLPALALVYALTVQAARNKPRSTTVSVRDGFCTRQSRVCKKLVGAEFVLGELECLQSMALDTFVAVGMKRVRLLSRYVVESTLDLGRRSVLRAPASKYGKLVSASRELRASTVWCVTRHHSLTGALPPKHSQTVAP